VLFRALPRCDVKPVASRLLETFRDFNHVLSAPVSRLTDVHGVGFALVRDFKLIEAVAHRMARRVSGNRPCCRRGMRFGTIQAQRFHT